MESLSTDIETVQYGIVGSDEGTLHKRLVASVMTKRGRRRNEGTTAESQDRYGTWVRRNFRDVKSVTSRPEKKKRRHIFL